MECGVLDLAALSAKIHAEIDTLPEGGDKHSAAAHLVTALLHWAMVFLEEDFHWLLKDPRMAKAANEQGPHEPDRCVLSPPTSDASGCAGKEAAPPYTPETVDRLRAMVDAMVAAGYARECTSMFLVARRNAFAAAMQGIRYEKVQHRRRGEDNANIAKLTVEVDGRTDKKLNF